MSSRSAPMGLRRSSASSTRRSSPGSGCPANEFGNESLDEVPWNWSLVREADRVLACPIGADIGFEIRVESWDGVEPNVLLPRPEVDEVLAIEQEARHLVAD